ncbi:3-oxoacyl-[acyl-carrier protein] reductase [Hydrogenivirga caldilitoris]|uniref:3-oxoacyl-[acyl-carrier protein] reductase n=1 Tax=Hydrogenivirga caldilitoris TaxID=246264 RepID=A0A497XQ04_9AQUI|nr:SDR family oxidoreductase [Hydrogenivirga caldilitoris]RLJ70978.1 3-oxoacyl-[acyl-carrier protein] reductase [Hydrogenivirga caldilitoris]
MKGKVVLITGSSVGIGRYTAYEFARAGANVVLTYYRDKEEGEKTLEKCLELGAQSATLLYLNLLDNESIMSCVKETASRYGNIDILINNAGVLAWKPLREQSFLEIETQIRVNLEGLIKLTKTALPYVKEMVINIGSGAGKTGFSELTTYCATKFGVRGFTQALAEEERGIKVYAVNPGMTATRMTGYSGVHPEKVAKVIFKVATGGIRKPSGSDVDVWEYL